VTRDVALSLDAAMRLVLNESLHQNFRAFAIELRAFSQSSGVGSICFFFAIVVLENADDHVELASIPMTKPVSAQRSPRIARRSSGGSSFLRHTLSWCRAAPGRGKMTSGA
jgi:hypothetical protein